jgi:hypothetical protein
MLETQGAMSDRHLSEQLSDGRLACVTARLPFGPWAAPLPPTSASDPDGPGRASSVWPGATQTMAPSVCRSFDPSVEFRPVPFQVLLRCATLRLVEGAVRGAPEVLSGETPPGVLSPQQQQQQQLASGSDGGDGSGGASAVARNPGAAAATATPEAAARAQAQQLREDCFRVLFEVLPSAGGPRVQPIELPLGLLTADRLPPPAAPFLGHHRLLLRASWSALVQWQYSAGSELDTKVTHATPVAGTPAASRSGGLPLDYLSGVVRELLTLFYGRVSGMTSYASEALGMLLTVPGIRKTFQPAMASKLLGDLSVSVCPL